MNIQYVLAFLFSEDKRELLLIRKNKPQWQRGRLNGIGGKIEPGEKPEDAILREIAEETGLVLSPSDITFKGIMLAPDYDLFLYASYGDIQAARSITDEKLIPIKVKDLDSYDTIDNLKWLVPFVNDGTVRSAQFYY